MNKKHILSALLCAAAVSFTSCIEENFEKVNPAQDGDEIVFGARAGFENGNPDTRTVYSGETYNVNGVQFERIDWLDKPAEPQEGEWWDMIEVYSPDAANGPTAHYEINHSATADDKKDYAYLSRIDGSGLQWNGDEPHDFYAMYPSARLFEGDKTLTQGVKMDGMTLRGVIPGAQAPARIEHDGNGNYVAVPNMKYAYMAAKASASRLDGHVSMTFVPIVTAVQIELQMPTAESGNGQSGELIPTSIAEIQVQGNGIAGAFSANLKEWDETYPPCENDGDGSGSIQVSTWMNGQPVKIEEGKTFTFTVFLRPGADVSDLTIRISPTGSSYSGKTIQGVTIPAKKKTILNNLMLPSQGVAIDASRWMDQLSPTMEIKKLSIPGTGGSFSYNYTGSNRARYQQQTIDFTKQWNAGIRAFEIVSDRPSSGSTSLGGQNVKCNKQSMGVTVLEVLQDLLNKVAAIPEGYSEPTECAVLILTYQPEGNNPNRNAAQYAESLKNMYVGLTETQKTQIIPYTPDITLEQAKGKVMLICRLNQRDEKEGTSYAGEQGAAEQNYATAVSTLQSVPCVIVNGCGTGKDKWGARGYTINDKRAPDISNSYQMFGHEAYIEQYMTSGYLDPTTHANVSKGQTQFGYETNDPDVTCWFQEWARVVPENMRQSSSSRIYWFESYSEKLANAKEAFTMAISDSYPKYIFINSLCGYFTDTDISDSVSPSTGTTYGGSGGDIAGLAAKINPDFYAYVLNAGLEQTTGPTGIVMMDYIKDTPSGDNDGGYYLPGVIIANNFKFGSGNSGNNGSTGGNGNPDVEGPVTDPDNPDGDEGM